MKNTPAPPPIAPAGSLAVLAFGAQAIRAWKAAVEQARNHAR